MALKDLLVVIGPGSEAPGTYGLGLAAACRATVTAATPVGEPYLPSSAAAELPEDIVAWTRPETEIAETAVSRVLRRFMDSAKEWDVPTKILTFQAQAGGVNEEVGLLARFYDVTIIQQADPVGTDTSAMIKAALFRSGRPVLIVPYIGIDARPKIRTVLVGWDGGPTAVRAAGDALPLLELARRVQVVTVDDNVIGDRFRSAERMVQHLARHGVRAEAKFLVRRNDLTVADLLLSHAADEHADLIVMGGYGHSRLQEAVLGSTTRDMLREMSRPVLMAH